MSDDANNAEIEVTEEMLRAGVRTLMEHGCVIEADTSELGEMVIACYRAMRSIAEST